MRILHTLFSSGFAGTERATAEMCNALCGAHEVALAVRRGHRNRAGASIVDALVRPDLLSRSLIAQLPARATDAGRRVTPAELKAGVGGRLPRVLGALVAAARASRPVEVPSTVQVLSSFAGGQHGTHLLSFDSALERAGVDGGRRIRHHQVQLA